MYLNSTRFRNTTIRFAKTRHLKIYDFRNIVHFLKRTVQVVDNAVFWQNVLLYFESDPLVVTRGHVTYQIYPWFETFKGNVNRTNTANFDAHWTSGAQKRRFWIALSVP